MPNITSIPAPRVPFVDDRTGLISREWYRFMLNLFTLTGSGASDLTITDLAIAPNPVDPFTVLGSAIEQSQLASIAAQYSQFLDIVGVAPVGQQQAAAFDDLAPVAIPYVAPTAAEEATVLAATIHAATIKTTPVDADELPLVDSAASNILKKLTWANLKATLASWIGGNLIAASFTTLTTSSTPTFNTNIGYIGASGTGTGGNWRFKADSGTATWLTGILGSAGATTFVIYDIVNGHAPFSVTKAATGSSVISVGTNKFTGAGIQATAAAGFISSDGSTGYTGTVTTADLVGKTITIKDGIITNFA